MCRELSLERRKSKPRVAISAQKKSIEAIAQSAYTVIEDDGEIGLIGVHGSTDFQFGTFPGQRGAGSFRVDILLP
jgi:hypothetical protein